DPSSRAGVSALGSSSNDPAWKPVPEPGGIPPVPGVAGLGANFRSWTMVLILAILAGLAAWWGGGYTYGYFRPSRAASETPRDFTALNREMLTVNAYNGALTFGALGGLLGLALGAAGGLIRRSAGGAVLGAIVGLILGTAAGALPSLVVMPWQWQHR